MLPSVPARILLCAAALSGLASAVRAQTEPENLLQQQRVIDDKLNRQRSALAPMDSFLDWQWGGWVDYYVFHFDDGIQRQRVLQRPGLSLWTRLRMDDGAHEFFGRMRLNYNYYNPGDQFDRQQDWEGPNLDRGWYKIDIGKAFRLTQPDGPVQASIQVGRQETYFGTGLVLDLPMDAVVLNAKVHDFRVTGLFGKTIHRLPNIDRSLPVADHSSRRFFGVQLAYEGFEKHVPFAYALWNDDSTREHRKDYYQDYSYDTQYFGVGSRGELMHNLNYWTEWVLETGRSFSNGNFIRQDPVEAWAWDIGIEKRFDTRFHPWAAAEYMFASGDGDRIFSPTNAAGGNLTGTDDTSFNAFGFRDTGISFGPALSNLHIWRLGGGFNPLEEIELFREMELGTNWFLYHKHHHRAALSDSTADMFNGFAGWEMDYFVNWRLSADLSWTLRWGMFFPGDAFSDRDERSFLFTGVTWSF